MNNKQSVVITGADGFIGSHLTRYFLSQNMEIYAVIIKNSPLRSNLDSLAGVHIIEGDLSDVTTFSTQLPQKPIALIHLAWAGVSPEARNQIGLQQINLNLCLNAVRLANLIQAQRFILPGSTLEYAYCGQKINESAVPSPQNAYGAVKIAVRYLCESLCEELNVPFIYAVITGIYSADRKDNNIIYYTISKLLAGERPSFTKLEQIWDYIHIDDLVRALYLISLKGKSGAFYSIGHGDNWALSNYIYQIRDLIDPKLPLGIGEIPYKDGKIPASCTDLRSLQADTGFEPEISFQDGIREVIYNVAQTMKQEK